MKIAVTGSSGFVGSKLVAKLKDIGHEIIEIDISNGLDICDSYILESIPHFDILFHLAARVFVPESYNDPLAFYKTNVTGTQNMLELCRRNNSRMVFASSYVYGTPEYLPIDEIHSLDPFNPYAHTKILGENLCYGYNKFFHVPCIIFRPFNIYGAEQNTNFLISEIFNQIKEKGSIELKNSIPKRDFIHVDDVIEAYLISLAYFPKGIETFNLGSGESISVGDLVSKIVALFPDMEIRIKFLDEIRKNEVLDVIADISKSKSVLNWKPKIDLQKGLQSFLLNV